MPSSISAPPDAGVDRAWPGGLYLEPWVARYTEAGGLEIVRAHAPGPAVLERGSLTVLLDGELHNRAELIRLHDLQTSEVDDVEIVALAWERVGLDALTDLRGIFSLLVHDRERGALVGARDAMGNQPLVRTRIGDAWLFSNDIDVLVSLPDVPRRLSREVIACYVTYRWPEAHETFYEGVHRVPLSHALEIRDGAERTFLYWHAPIPELETTWIRDHAGEGFAEVFEESVRRRIGLGRPGIFLSGGLDSVSVAAFATDLCARAGRESPIALSLAFPGQLSEEPVQRAVAEALGLEQIMMSFRDAAGSERILPVALEAARTWPTPWFPFWHVAYLGLARAGAAAGARVLLTGGGGDEWLTVDPRWGADLIWRCNLPGLYRHLRNCQRSYRVSLLPMLRAYLWTHGMKPLALSLGVRGLQKFSRRGLHRFLDWYATRQMAVVPDWALADPELRGRIRDRVFHEVHENKTWARPGQAYVHLMHSTHHRIMETETEGQFEMSRASGMRMLLPYWDVDVMAFLRRVHPDALRQGGISKGPVRNAMAARFPDLGFERQKKLLAGDHFSDLMKADAPAAYESLGRLRLLREMGVIDGERFQAQVVDRIHDPIGVRARSQLWMALRFESWMQSHA